MTTRIDARFAELKKEGRSAFITFLMAGDPDPATSLEIIKALPKAGADIIEIGMPFTDPMADGPAIQASGLRALKAGMTLRKTLDMVRAFRNSDDATPLVLMGYYNPIYIYGVDQFLVDAKSAGVDGLIIVDLPPARWSAPPWSMPCAPASMPKAAPRPKPSARWRISWPPWRRVCGERNRLRNKPRLRWRRAANAGLPGTSLAAIYQAIRRFGAKHELAHQRRPAEDPQHPAPRDAGKFVDQMPGFGAARVLQGRRGQPVRHSRIELPHAHGRGGAAEIDLRQRDLVRRGAARGDRRSPKISRRT